ncbi:MAG: thiamine phosphate synthase, partial [Deltaproteobacteria bacterium]|nr:thiamine phosphate synthase [Deltaproteobacteria bacterium]
MSFFGVAGSSASGSGVGSGVGSGSGAVSATGAGAGSGRGCSLGAAAGVAFVVNDAPPLARTVAADGLHLGQTDGPVADA